MHTDALVNALREVSGAGSQNDIFNFDLKRGLTFLVAAGGTMLSIDRVRRVVVTRGELSIETDRRERYFIEANDVIAIRAQDETEASGFMHPGSTR